MKAAEVVLGVLLLVGLGEAALLAARATQTPRVLLPLLVPGDAPGELFQPGGATRVLVGRTAGIGDYVTVEDLARGALAASKGELPGAPPLTEGERARLSELVARADTHRRELLATEAELAAAEREMDAAALAVLRTLDADQRAWLLAHRDQTSVGQVEAEYWAELLETLGAPPGPAAPR